MIAQILSGRRIRMLGVSLIFGLLMVMVSDYVYAGLGTDIRFSRESGFYEESFYLEITAGQNEDWMLYYTLDGSMPDTTSPQYTGPILMEDVSYKENVYSAREDISRADYKKPDYPIDKCNVVRAAVYDKEKNLISEATGVYFIGFQDKSGYDGMMRVSIVTEPDSLFDEETGIYVSGENSGQADQWENYFQRGEDWERTASVAVFDADGTELMSTNAGVRIHGGYTRTLPQKSFTIFAREQYGGSNRFAYDFFENGIGPHKFILAAGGDDINLKIRDYIVQTSAMEAGMNYAVSRMFPCVLFLNGEYWGAYYLSESYDESYIEDHYGIDKDNVVVVRKNRGEDVIENGTQEDMELYAEMTEYITTHDMKDDACFEKACEMIDIDSFVDYYATEIYIGNRDWLWNNMALWRVRNKNTANRYADGRWRYILFDTNSPTIFEDPSICGVVWAIFDDELFGSLIQNNVVWNKFWERIDYLGSGVYSLESTKPLFDRWHDVIRVPISKGNERFFGSSAMSPDDMAFNADSIKMFLQERLQWLQGYKALYESEGVHREGESIYWMEER